MANPCSTHTDFHGDLCPVCLMEERDRLRCELTEQLDTLREAVKPLYRTEWPHRVYEILASRNYALAEQFAKVMHDLHEAMEPLATDDPASDNGDTVEAEQGVLW